jgi:2-keto-4-pentenoate hydratase/2-oxohepta-3-ene-1,7-dioic acid hydratase in catechol pathway
VRIAAFEAPGGQARLGLVRPDGVEVLDITEQAGTNDLVTLIERWADVGSRLAFAGPAYRVGDLSFLAPIARPRRNIFCIGKNYRAHAAEFDGSGFNAGAAAHQGVPARPVVFTKPNTAVVGHRRAIDPHLRLTRMLDYEAELAVIIGRKGRGIAREDARAHVWGYTIINDVTARDLQRDHEQWFLGKGLDTFCPMGPFAVTAEEVDDRDLLVECRVNGELRQHASTAELVFDVPELIATISAGLTLLPGDVIATGTPAGVGAGMKPPRFLQPRDRVEISVSGLGTLINHIASPEEA